MQVLPAAQLTAATEHRQPTRPSPGEEINKMGSTRTADHPEMTEGTHDGSARPPQRRPPSLRTRLGEERQPRDRTPRDLMSRNLERTPLWIDRKQREVAHTWGRRGDHLLRSTREPDRCRCRGTALGPDAGGTFQQADESSTKTPKHKSARRVGLETPLFPERLGSSRQYSNGSDLLTQQVHCRIPFFILEIYSSFIYAFSGLRLVWNLTEVLLQGFMQMPAGQSFDPTCSPQRPNPRPKKACVWS